MVVVVIVFIGVFLFDFLYRRSTAFLGVQQQFTHLENMPQNLDYLVVGSGPAKYAFDFIGTGINGYNMAIWSEDFRYDARMLCEYAHNVHYRHTIVHVIYLLSFAENGYMLEDSFSARYVYTLPVSMVDLPLYKYYLFKYFPFLSCPVSALKAVIKILLFMDKKQRFLLDDQPMDEQKEKCISMCKCWISNNVPLKDLKDASMADHPVFKTAFERTVKDLNEVYATARKNGLEYYAVITPVSEFMRKELFSEDFLRRFLYENIQRSEIPADRVLDYSKDASFAGLENYLNGIFLNSQARKRFTEKVIRDIEVKNCMALNV